jgi:hypothetical protein
MNLKRSNRKSSRRAVACGWMVDVQPVAENDVPGRVDRTRPHPDNGAGAVAAVAAIERPIR